MEYDELGRLIHTFNPDGTVTTNEYNIAGQVLVATDVLGHRTYYGCNELGLQVPMRTGILPRLNTMRTAGGEAPWPENQVLLKGRLILAYFLATRRGFSIIKPRPEAVAAATADHAVMLLAEGW